MDFRCERHPEVTGAGEFHKCSGTQIALSFSHAHHQENERNEAWLSPASRVADDPSHSDRRSRDSTSGATNAENCALIAEKRVCVVDAALGNRIPEAFFDCRRSGHRGGRYSRSALRDIHGVSLRRANGR